MPNVKYLPTIRWKAVTSFSVSPAKPERSGHSGFFSENSSNTFQLKRQNISEASNRLRHRRENLKVHVAWRSHSCFRCGSCTTSKVRSTHFLLNRKTCSTGLQRTAGTVTSRFRTIVGCTMTNASNRTPNLITTMRQTRRRRRVAVLPYCYWLLDIAKFCIAQFVMPRSYGSCRDVICGDIVLRTSA